MQTTKTENPSKTTRPGRSGARARRSTSQTKSRAQRHQELDELCKQAMATDRARLLDLVLTPPVREKLQLPDAPVELLEILPTEMRRKRVHADYLIRVRIGGRVVLLHVEFQNRADPQIAVRVMQYQAGAVAQHGLPVYSVVFNVHSGVGRAIEVQGQQWGMLMMGWVEVAVGVAVKGWGQGESPLAVVLATLLGELSDEDLNQCLWRLRELGLDEETCRDLVEAVCFLADVKHKGPREATKKRLFMKLRINQTWLFQEGLQEGRKEGVEEGIEKGIEKERIETLNTMQRTVVEVCRRRFGAPPDERSLERIRQIREPGFLSWLLVQLTTASSLPEALAGLPAT